MAVQRLEGKPVGRQEEGGRDPHLRSDLTGAVAECAWALRTPDVFPVYSVCQCQMEFCQPHLYAGCRPAELSVRDTGFCRSAESCIRCGEAPRKAVLYHTFYVHFISSGSSWLLLAGHAVRVDRSTDVTLPDLLCLYRDLILEEGSPVVSSVGSFCGCARLYATQADSCTPRKNAGRRVFRSAELLHVDQPHRPETRGVPCTAPAAPSSTHGRV